MGWDNEDEDRYERDAKPYEDRIAQLEADVGDLSERHAKLFSAAAFHQERADKAEAEVKRLQELVRSMVLSHPQTCVPTASS